MKKYNVVFINWFNGKMKFIKTAKKERKINPKIATSIIISLFSFLSNIFERIIDISKDWKDEKKKFIIIKINYHYSCF